MLVYQRVSKWGKKGGCTSHVHEVQWIHTRHMVDGNPWQDIVLRISARFVAYIYNMTYVCRYASIRELYHVLYTCTILFNFHGAVLQNLSFWCFNRIYHTLIIAWWVISKHTMYLKMATFQLWKIRGNDWLQLEACQLKYADTYIYWRTISLNIHPDFVKNIPIYTHSY